MRGAALRRPRNWIHPGLISIHHSGGARDPSDSGNAHEKKVGVLFFSSGRLFYIYASMGRINEYLFSLHKPESRDYMNYRVYAKTLEEAWSSINGRSLYKDWEPRLVKIYEN